MLLPDHFQTSMECETTQGESPVERGREEDSLYLSRAGHVKPGLNLGRPLSKAKYSLMTDSGLVP